MKIGIIGGGAIGLLVAVHMASKHQVSLYVRSENQKKLISEHGVTCRDLHQRVSVYTNRENLNEQELIIIAVKQHHIQEVVSNLPSAPALLFLQNGMTHLSAIQSVPNPCVLGVVEHGALKVSDYQVIHTGYGSIQLAVHHGGVNIDSWVEGFSEKEFPFKKRESYWEMLTEKLIVNTVINPLTAIFQVKNKEIVENDHINKLAELLCEEACRALQLSFRDQWARVCYIAENTGENMSSMLKDLNEGRKTEIDAICGFVLRTLKEDDAPFHQFVLESVHALELINQKGGAS
ncbi:ketopantoate reductase family protein [Halobacillus seohaensis]|uniref:2-dehydropantoate 2-reductase n=1 Tax=Halobacillus seohaensis TaxID=447421 RepID=A0ABW2EG65_9BACI